MHLVYADRASLARAAAEHFVGRAQEAIAERGSFFVALAGGSTPRSAYGLLSSDEFAGQIDWAQVHVFWGDERMVPPDHPDSNYRMAREALLDRVPLPEVNAHRIAGELPPRDAAAAYQRELQAVLGAVLGEEARFDLILLGMGADGHTASLFPGTDALTEHERWVVPVYVEKLDAWRVTMTLPLINAARSVLFLVSGADKADALHRIQAGADLPAGAVLPVDGHLLWLTDSEASGA